VTLADIKPKAGWVVRCALICAILLLLFLKFRLLTLVNVNWDEFRFLSRIHELRSGNLVTAFQTFHARLFTWLPGIAGNEVDEVIIGRRVAFAMRIAVCALLFLIGRRLYGATGGLFAVLVSLGFSHLVRHGEAFRADPIIAFLFVLAAAWLILRPSSQWAAVGAGIAMALAALVSVKAAIYLPTIAVAFLAAWATPGDRRASGRRPAWFVGVATATFIGVHFLHAGALQGSEPGSVAAALSRAGQVGVSLLGESPYPDALVESLRLDSVFWPLLVLGSCLAATEALRGAGVVRRNAVVVLGMLLPIVSLFAYRNTFAYYYATIIPPASLACGLVAARLDGWLSQRPTLRVTAILCLAVPLAAPGAKAYGLLRHDTTVSQRRVLEAVRDVFPEPVAYIDRCSMVATYPKVGPFFTTYVLAAYRARAKPIMPGLVRERQPVFILANVVALDLSADWGAFGGQSHVLLREDFDFLRARYVHHWGPIYVAGASFEAVPGVDRAFDLPVDGTYTIETTGTVFVDGQLLAGGVATRLAAGLHVAQSRDARKPLTLRYGDHLPRPSNPPPMTPLFLDLGFRGLEQPAGR
jgi:hypothetical protein